MISFLSEYEATISGLIFMLVLGPAFGNYACSIVYRLPLGKTPFERHPYCGHCNADLKPIDLFPILSYFMTRGRCRYCGGKIPGIYTVVELACLILFVCMFLRFGLSESFLLYTAAGFFAITLAAIQWQQGWISATLYSYAFIALALERTRAEGTIYGWFTNGVTVLVFALIAEWLRCWIFKRRPPRIADAHWVWWAVLASIISWR
jgi:prepilin signal peptidase PulO-like enzyme (type II secretory pathway)